MFKGRPHYFDPAGYVETGSWASTPWYIKIFRILTSLSFDRLTRASKRDQQYVPLSEWLLTANIDDSGMHLLLPKVQAAANKVSSRRAEVRESLKKETDIE